MVITVVHAPGILNSFLLYFAKRLTIIRFGSCLVPVIRNIVKRIKYTKMRTGNKGNTTT